MDVVHPIGFVMESFTFNTNLLTGGQTYNTSWNGRPLLLLHSQHQHQRPQRRPYFASPVSFDDDDRNENDQRDLVVPVAVNANTMEDFQALALGSSLENIRQMEAMQPQGVVANRRDSKRCWIQHFRHSSPGATTLPTQKRPALSTPAPAVRVDNAKPMRSTLVSANLPDMVVQSVVLFQRIRFEPIPPSSGVMAAGDSVSMELWRGSSNINDPYESVSWDISQGNPSAAPGQWTNLSWDPQGHGCKYPTLRTPKSSSVATPMPLASSSRRQQRRSEGFR